MIDYSFIRLETSLEKAKDVQNQRVARVVHTSPIQLFPDETYLQVTNLSSGIAFDGDIKVEIINCGGGVLSDITDSFYVYEFVDLNGLNQIAFEFGNLTEDYGFQQVHLKLTHTSGNDIYYSNGFFLTSEYAEFTTRFDYKNYDDVTNYYKSIRLITYFDNVENETEVTEYYQISTQNTISSRAQYKQLESYKIDYIDRFTYERLNTLFINDVIYCDGIRITNKPQAKNSERQGFSNFFESSFTCFKNYNDTYSFEYQIYEYLDLIYRSPEGNYSLATIPNNLEMQFNKNISLVGGYLTIYDDLTNNVIAVFDDNDFIVANSFATTDISYLGLSYGTYRVELDANFVYSGDEVYGGATWVFVIRVPDYSATHYSNDYFI